MSLLDVLSMHVKLYHLFEWKKVPLANRKYHANILKKVQIGVLFSNYFALANACAHVCVRKLIENQMVILGVVSGVSDFKAGVTF